MKKTLIFASMFVAALTFASCSCQNNAGKKGGEAAEAAEAPAAPEYTVVEKPQVDLSTLEKDADGYYIIFNGKDLTGWRTYGKDVATSRWSVEDGCIKFAGSGGGEAQTGEGGDLIFAHKFIKEPVYLHIKTIQGLLQIFIFDVILSLVIRSTHNKHCQNSCIFKRLNL